MENLSVNKIQGGIEIEGYKDCRRVIYLKNCWARQLSDISLHNDDLVFALDCLQRVNKHDDNFVQESLYRNAIVLFVKCFVSSRARSKLTAKKIWKGNGEALECFNYFKDLRDKHISHDENLYHQSQVGAIINDGKKSYKVEKVITTTVRGVLLEQENYSNLYKLIEESLDWVKEKYNELCNTISEDLEKKDYEELMKEEILTFKIPRAEDVSITRDEKQ